MAVPVLLRMSPEAKFVSVVTQYASVVGHVKLLDEVTPKNALLADLFTNGRESALT